MVATKRDLVSFACLSPESAIRIIPKTFSQGILSKNFTYVESRVRE